jgi:hypothetical protein
MSKIILSLHPVFQCLAIFLAFYGAFLGFQRTRSLHFSRQSVIFRRKRHALVGFIALVLLLGGMAGGKIIAHIVWQGMVVIHLHEGLALLILPFLLIGMVSGLYLYFSPAKRRVLPAVHAINNGILLVLLLYQAYSGIHVYLRYVLKIR